MRRIIHALAIASLALPLSVSLPAAAQSSAVTPPAAPNAASSAQPAPFAPGIVLIGLNPDQGVALRLAGSPASATSLQGVLAALGVQQLEPVFGPDVSQSGAGLSPAAPTALSGIYRLHLPAGADVLQAVVALQSDPAVAYAEPDYVAQLITTPNDPLYADQWALAAVNASAAWDVVTGTTDVTIAVIDSGLDLTHPDLANQLWTNPGETPSNGLDDDNNGFVDDLHGANIYSHNVDLTDTTGHGTQVAGIIAAETDNAIGVAGVCWQCRLMVVKVVQPGGIANYSDIAAGIAYAAQKGAEVINLSLGGLTDSSTLRAAIEAASATAVVVAGAGNNGNDAPFYPAAYGTVLAVAGTTITDTKVGTSNYGAWVDLTAPGELITTTTSGGGYGLASGTSLAAPFVAGVAGLLRSQHPDWSPALVQAQILQTAEDIDASNPTYAGLLGHGRLDAAAAVTTAAEPDLTLKLVTINGQPNNQPAPGTQADLFLTLYNDWGPAANLQATLTGGGPHVSIVTGTVSYGTLGAYQGAAASVPLRINIAGGAGFGTTLPFTLNLTADGGFAASLPLTVTTQASTLNVSGTIVTNTVWTNNRVYHVVNDVGVNAGVTLTIEAGTVIKFDADRRLYVFGTLIAVGTTEAPIRFTSASLSPAAADWDRIGFAPSSVPGLYDEGLNYLGGSVIMHAIIEYAGDVYLEAASPYFAYNRMRQMSVGLAGDSNGSAPPAIIYNTFDAVNVSHGGNNGFNIIGNLLTGGATLTANGPGLVERNSISGGGGLSVQAATVISNRVVGATRALFIQNPQLVSGNLFATSSITGFVIANVVTMTDNTLISGNGPALWVNSGPSSTLHENNLLAYNGQLALKNFTPNSIDAANNWWGTVNTSFIDALIYDDADAIGMGHVGYSPVLTGPVAAAPAYVHSIAISPDLTLGIQTGTFDLTFSAPMDQSVNPTVTFGAASPFATFPLLDHATWLDATHWQATFDFTSLIARSAYTLSVSGAVGLDGIEIAPDTRFSFLVDYAGEITDQTPPAPPTIVATGADTNAGFVQAVWSAAGGASLTASPSAVSSAVTGYRYAIGSAPGATDVVNWTPTTATFLTRTIPGLAAGHTYWFSVQAQNAGGLWSPAGQASFVAGLQTHWWAYLPLTFR